MGDCPRKSRSGRLLQGDRGGEADCLCAWNCAETNPARWTENGYFREDVI